MFKRLAISLLLMGLAAFGLGAAAFAWFSTSESGEVSITAGSANIAIDVDIDCNGGPDATIDGDPFEFDWEGIVPGDTTQDCFTVHNTGSGDLDVYVQHGQAFGALADVLQFTYDTDPDASNGDICGPALAGAGGFTTGNGGRGCLLGSVTEGGSLNFVARVTFPYSNSDQNAYANGAFSMTSVVTGYTQP